MFHPLRAIPAEHKLNAYVRRGPVNDQHGSTPHAR